jgi:predicted RecB family nuclease
MYSQDTGNYNELARESLRQVSETIKEFKALTKQFKIPAKDVKEHRRLLKISDDLHEKTRQDNLWNRDSPKDYGKCMDAALDVWLHYYRLMCAYKGYN